MEEIKKNERQIDRWKDSKRYLINDLFTQILITNYYYKYR